MLRYGQSLTFFDPDAIGTSVFYDDLGEVVTSDGLPGVVDQIDALLKEHRPGSSSSTASRHSRAFAPTKPTSGGSSTISPVDSTAVAASSFWIGEYDRRQAAEAPEFAVADAIIALHANRTGERESACFRCSSSAGVASRPGEHAYRIGRRRLRRLSSARRRLRHHELHARARTRRLDRDRGPRRDAGGRLLAGRSDAHRAARPAPARRSWDCTSCSTAPTTASPASWRPFRSTRRSSPASQRFGWDFDRSDGRRAHGPLTRRPLRRRVGLRPARRASNGPTLAASSSTASATSVRVAGRDPLPGTHVLPVATPLAAWCQSDDDLESCRALPVTRLSEIGMSHLADNVVVLQYFRDESTVKRALPFSRPARVAMTRDPRVQDHSRRDRARRPVRPATVFD